MPKIYVNADGIIQSRGELQKARSRLTAVSDGLSGVQRRLRAENVGRSPLPSDIASAKALALRAAERVSRLERFSSEAAADYIDCENRIKNDFNGYATLKSVSAVSSGSLKNDAVFGVYTDLVKEYFTKRLKSAFSSLEDCETLSEAITELYTGYVKDFRSDAKAIAGVIDTLKENFTSEKTGFDDSPVGKTLSILDKCDILIDAAKSIKKYTETGDGYKAYEEIGLSIYETVVKKGVKALDKAEGLKYIGADKLGQSVLVNTIAKMPGEWLTGIQDYAENGTGTAGSIVANTVIGTLAGSAASAAAPYYIGATALTYPIVDGICDAVGYDLSGEYERLTGKTGLDAVFSAQKELWVDNVGKGIMDAAGKGVDALYSGASWMWENWNGGMARLSGKK